MVGVGKTDGLKVDLLVRALFAIGWSSRSGSSTLTELRLSHPKLVMNRQSALVILHGAGEFPQ